MSTHETPTPRTSVADRTWDVEPSNLEAPLRTRQPCVWDVRSAYGYDGTRKTSMSDLFHPQVSDEFIAQVFAVMAATPQHTYQILTKRPKRMRALLRDECKCHVAGTHFRSAMEWAATPDSPTYVPGLESGLYHRMQWPLPNVWLGVSCEDQQRADQRIPILLDTPAAIRFISAEPLLGCVDLVPPLRTWADGRAIQINQHLQWVICGGESGPGARPMHPAWARSIVQQCRDAGVAVFVKQMGAWQMTGDADADVVDGSRMRRVGGHGGDPDEWPTDLRVREFPRTEVIA